MTISLATAQQDARLMRFPTVSKDAIVFSYAEDLYTVARTGGVARKLTTDVGNEIFARFSPDGQTLAFTGQYDGNTEVYKMPAAGGIPVRLTYTATLGRDDLGDRMGPNNLVMTWKNDNSGIVYRSRNTSFNAFKGRLYIANVNGGPSTEMPFSVGGFCSYSPDGSKLAMNQVFREFRTWKYYKGGMADDVWIYDMKTSTWENITNNIAQDIFPMWSGDKIYFCSDRDRTMNLFSYDTKTKQISKLTNYTNYDIKFPSLGPDAIVYENGGYIYLYDLKTGTDKKVPITISDDAASGRNEMIDASKFMENGDYDISPDGNRMAITARGDVWTLPAKEGITRDITKTSSVHERAVVWSGDGKMVAFISDATGEDEIYIQKQDGSEAAVKLTQGADTYKYYLVWSPDNKKIAWADKKLRLQYVDVGSKTVTLIDQSKTGEYDGVSWSPDSKWIAFTRSGDDFRSNVFLFDTRSKKSTPVTDNWYQAYGATFSMDGKYLFFVSDRDFNPTYSSVEWNHSYSDMSRIYFVTLAKATKSPLAPENDEVEIKPDSFFLSDATKPVETKKDNTKKEKTTPSESTTKPGEAKKDSAAVTKIDLDGIQDRILDLPLSAGNYFGITVSGDLVYYLTNSSRDRETKLKVYDLKEKEEKEIGAYDSYILSDNRKKMLLSKSRTFAIVDAPKAKTAMEDKVDLSNMKIVVDKKKEWEQIFNESWRQMRDFFYDPGMHGVDWPAMKEKYKALLPSVSHRTDLTYIIGEMIGELSVGHAYVGGGDAPRAERIPQGLLGAKLGRDTSGYFKINEILKGENWTDDTRSPLTEVGVDVKTGDYIIAVNGISVKTVSDINELLVNTAGKTTELTINGNASAKGSHKTLVVPTADESGLYYLQWVRKNIAYVTEKTNGDVGYIHIPDMGVEGLNEFVKYFYPQLQKKALIIDDRGNGGGNVSPHIVERLKREAAFYTLPRNISIPQADPDMQVGPKVLLIDQYSASDGDLFPYRFRKYGLGKIIGKRSWGGVVGIRGSLPFIDGGSLSKPEFSRYDAAGGDTWPIEGHGVDPDIEIFNSPSDEYLGKDNQLDKAIEVIKVELGQRKDTPAPPPYPKKN
ncbi:MAG TPA: PDZ domain-containing protein [Saprospiraceae bacterium]|nr:PDZ domain-containing protein [Saprospiraceae bacterium]